LKKYQFYNIVCVLNQPNIMNPEKPIAQFFDGERQVKILPPEQEDIYNIQKNIPTVNIEITAEEAKSKSSLDKITFLPEDEKELKLKGKISPERIKKYLKPENGERLEIFKISKAKINLIAFQNVDERRAGLFAYYAGTNKQPLTYTELLLAFHKNGWMKEIGMLEDEIKKRSLDTDSLIYYFPADTVYGRKKTK